MGARRRLSCPWPLALPAQGPWGCGGRVPEIVPPAELPAQLVVEAPPHLAQPAPAEVTAEAVLVPVLVDGLQEVAVPDVLLAPATCQQGRGDLQDLIHWLPGKNTCVRDNLGMGTRGEPSLWAEQDSFSLETGERTGLHIQRPDRWQRGPASLGQDRRERGLPPSMLWKKMPVALHPGPRALHRSGALCPLPSLVFISFFHPPFLQSLAISPSFSSFQA